jgi:hypothetical protein
MLSVQLQGFIPRKWAHFQDQILTLHTCMPRISHSSTGKVASGSVNLVLSQASAQTKHLEKENHTRMLAVVGFGEKR